MKMLICQKCKQEFPQTIILDGKRKNLQSRKYCLTCSPYGLHNTLDLNKFQKFKYVNKPGTKEYSSEKYQKHKTSLNKRATIYQRNKYKERKQILVDFLGGKCIKCGYNKNPSALDFHHKDPSKKDITISQFLKAGNMESLLKEAEKCVLLCANCHRELHDDIRNKFISEQDIKLPTSHTSLIKLTVEEIKTELKTKSMTLLAKELSISEGTLRKFMCENYINPVKLEHPLDKVSKEQLEELLPKHAMTEIGAMFGVSSNAIVNKCQRLNVDLSLRKNKRTSN